MEAKFKEYKQLIVPMKYLILEKGRIFQKYFHSRR